MKSRARFYVECPAAVEYGHLAKCLHASEARNERGTLKKEKKKENDGGG